MQKCHNSTNFIFWVKGSFVSMPRILISQPNGKYMIWSTIVDAPIATNLTSREYIKFISDEAAEWAKEQLGKCKPAKYVYDRLSIYNMSIDERRHLFDILLDCGYLSKVLQKEFDDQLKELEEFPL